MKKLLSILAIVGLTATAGASVVACSNGTQTENETKTVKFNMNKSNITISGDGNVIREITNFNDLKNVRVELIIADSVKNNVKVELDTISPYETKLTGGALKVTTINTDKLLETTQGTIKLTADGIETTKITLNLIKDVKPSKLIINTNREGNQSNVDMHKTDRIQITNFDKLENLTATVKNESIAKTELQFGNSFLVITGVKTGTTTIILSADNAVDLTITVNVQETRFNLNTFGYGFEPKLPRNTVPLEYSKESIKLTIANYLKTWVNKNVDFNELIKVTDDTDKVGFVTVDVTQENDYVIGQMKIDVIDARVDISKIDLKGFTSVNVNDSMEMINYAIETLIDNNTDATKADYKIIGDTHVNGVITIKSNEDSKLIKGEFTLEVIGKIDIDLSLDKWCYVKEEQTKNVQINNYQDLENIRLVPYNPQKTIDIKFDKENGLIQVIGLKEGTAQIDVSASNGFTITIWVIIDNHFTHNLNELEKIIGTINYDKNEDKLFKLAGEKVIALVKEKWDIDTVLEDYYIDFEPNSDNKQIMVGTAEGARSKGIEAMLTIDIVK